MRGFESNNCRLCERVFCCEKCRIKHETVFHEVLPLCDVCIYGHLILNSFEESFLHHLEVTHLPLHCVYCQKIFTTIEELLQHKKCLAPKPREQSPKTPFEQGTPSVVILADDQDSPILQEFQRKEALNYIFKLATSTPMQREVEPHVFEKSKEPITPVDKPLQVVNKSIIKKTDSNKSDNNSKRRVTFGETPGRKDTNNSIISDDKNTCPPTPSLNFESCNPNTVTTPVTSMNTTSQFFSAKTELDKFCTAQDMISQDVGETMFKQLEGYTPVCVPKESKILTAKGDLYKTEYVEIHKSSALFENSKDGLCQNQGGNLSEIPMELCTPTKISGNLVKDLGSSGSKIEESTGNICSEGSSRNEDKLSVEYKYDDKSKSRPTSSLNFDFGNTNTVRTPVTSMSTTSQFFTAKVEKDNFGTVQDMVSQDLGETELKKVEGCTPVSVPKEMKIITKGDLYKTDNVEIHKSLELIEESKVGLIQNQNSNLNELPMELCTPTKISIHLEKDSCNSGSNTEESSGNICSENPNRNEESSVECKSENPIEMKTPDIKCENDEMKASSTETSKSYVNHEKSCLKKEKNEDDEYEVVEHGPSNATTYKTLWLSATDLDDNSNDSQTQGSENEDLKENACQIVPNISTQLSPQPTRRRVSIVMPTPILKRTDVRMKFHVPAHLSSTPIMSSGAIKIKQTKIIEEISTRVIQQQTPFRTPQGKLSEDTKRSFLGAKVRMKLGGCDDSEAGPSDAYKGLVPVSASHENYSSSRTSSINDLMTYQSNIENECPTSTASVSSMTESTLWTSVTRIMRSVLGGFSNSSQEESAFTNNSTSVKRHLSDSDIPDDLIEAPRLKRFKFTDIKCRRPIRNLPALQAPQRMPRVSNDIATFEIVKSVSTFYNGKRFRIQCDKATQTDEYLMYGWCPQE